MNACILAAMSRRGEPALYEHPRRVIMADTDAAGVIYFGCVYRWHESAMQEWLRNAGHPIGKLLKEGYAIPCVHSEADYSHPLRVGDELTVQLRPGKVGTRSFQLVAECWLAEVQAVQVRLVYVWAQLATPSGQGFRLEPLPEWLLKALAVEVDAGQR
jgi:YbgC/YbaW family acyl-CoA thioester hydrolase